jgi:hypothetical protein
MPVSYNQMLKVTLLKVSADGRLIALHCRQCGRRANYFAADLSDVLGCMYRAWTPPFPCSRCQTAEHVEVKLVGLEQARKERYIVRRPEPHGKGWRWQNVRLSPP